MNKNDYAELESLLAAQWNGNAKMVDHCLKTGKYIKIADMFVSVCNLKPVITTRLYYDDTMQDPGTGWDRFSKQNERFNMPDFLVLERFVYGWPKRLFYIAHYHRDESNRKLCSLAYEPEFGNERTIREVTPDELETINAAIKEVQDDYRKRLEAYFKRYSAKISSTSYWADR